MESNMETLKNKVIEHLASVDLSKLDLQELKLYVDTVSVANSFVKADHLETLMKELLETKNTPMVPVGYGLCAAEKKEGE
jgi:hypothetical protein